MLCCGARVFSPHVWSLCLILPARKMKYLQGETFVRSSAVLILGSQVLLIYTVWVTISFVLIGACEGQR